MVLVSRVIQDFRVPLGQMDNPDLPEFKVRLEPGAASGP